MFAREADLAFAFRFVFLTLLVPLLGQASCARPEVEYYIPELTLPPGSVVIPGAPSSWASRSARSVCSRRIAR